MIKIEKYNITLQTVEEEDAELIISLRTNKKNSKYISETNENLSLQKEWIKKYKKREKDNLEYYFIAIDENGDKFATYRIYNIEKDICEIGSWVSKPKYNNPINSVKVDLIMKEFVFETLNFNQLRFEVNQKNKSVLKYHKLFSPEITNETDEEIFFVLKKDIFQEKRNKIFKNIK